MALRVASLDSEGLHRVEKYDLGAGRGRVSEERLLVCAQLKGAGHRGVDAMMAWLERQCVWKGMADDVRDMTRRCLYCSDTKAGALVPHIQGPLAGESRTQLRISIFFTLGRARWISALTLRMDFSTCWSLSRT